MIIKNKLLFNLIIILIILLNISYAEIIPTYSIAPNIKLIQDLMKKVDKTSLVLININDTIIMPQSKIFRHNNNPYSRFLDELFSIVPYRPAINILIARLLVQRKMMLVEPDWPNFINQLKDRGALVFGFTQLNSACNLIKNFEEWQYSQLNQFNINFTDKINNKEIFKFDDNDTKSPIFYKGILFTSTLDKTEALKQFMTITNITPLKVIVFENKKNELKKINSFLNTIDSDYYGIEYLAVQELNSTTDSEIAKIQYKTLLDKGIWLEDDTAKKLLENSIK